LAAAGFFSCLILERFLANFLGMVPYPFNSQFQDTT
jgi:hypothetical protein